MLRDGRDIKKKSMKAVFGVDHQISGECPKFGDSFQLYLLHDLIIILFIISPIYIHLKIPWWDSEGFWSAQIQIQARTLSAIIRINKWVL